MISLFKMDLDDFINKHKKQGKHLKKNTVANDIHRMYSLLDSKAASLLTHVSLMIAVCTFLYTSKFICQKFIILELLIYLIVALILLFCLGISMYSAPNNKKKWNNYYAISCKRRVSLYLIALYLTIAATLILVFLSFYKLIFLF